MSRRAVAVRLKIPDNEARTALTALQRLGVNVARLERADVWVMDSNEADFIERFKANETLFNANKHELEVLAEPAPRTGETWIEELDAADVPVRMSGVSRARRFTAWRLYDEQKQPADAATVQDAAQALLCNPAIERALTA